MRIILETVLILLLAGAVALLYEGGKQIRALRVQVVEQAAALDATPRVQAAYDAATGSVVIRINENNEALHLFPKLCPPSMSTSWGP